MKKIIDAKGLACPQPVVLTRKALETETSVTVLVDNETAKENIKRLAENSGCKLFIDQRDDGTFSIDLEKNGSSILPSSSSDEKNNSQINTGPDVFVISSDTMGKGNDELGAALMKAFIHTISDLDKLPDIMIFYNTGVRLTIKDSDVIDDLKKLEQSGVEILICGTCANFFSIKEDISAGTISNMYDIAGTMAGAGKIIMP